ncbi:HAMP domain-containing histidine kinase [Amycolatopsis thermalba]|uniref:histidine kinase n=1 Tax=Amycolatopsis thermalba TaxID=944492 RepID=A0ABY4NYY6_9PSEU|nr:MULTISPECIES: HAMP domain-containing sensor histidine kinase [Amycolatopsis]OXM75131.1 two-component sensor histidine kinase [Amycolatopsis sp. KNN50.9b]UQS25263.1 HAMP domain-containing histidine kinase [Amycolatopsis thermalba]
MTRFRRPLRQVLSLRWRVAVAFGLGSFLVSGLFALATWNLASGYMLDQRLQSATQQAAVNARLVEEAIRTGSGGLEELLTGLTTGPNATIIVQRPGHVLTGGRQVEFAELPRAFADAARSGTPVRQRLHVRDVPVLAVALPLATQGGFYVEIFPLAEIDRTFHFLSSLLAGGTLASGVLGGALGLWTSRRALRPLTALTAAASRVAAGDLGARLPQHADADLAPLARTFNETTQALEHRVQRDARFAGDVSHELRSPLTTMTSAAEVLHRRRDDLPETARRALDLLVLEVHRFRRMVIDLLEISRAGQQGDDDAWEVLDLRELVTNVLAHRNTSSPPVDAGPEPALVRGDRRRLDRIVGNLLDNAEHYAGGARRIGIGVGASRVRLEVDDEGPGVPAHLREQIFERFTRGTRAGDRRDGSGSGLGLAIVAEHARRLGGAAWAEDRPGGGSRFVVELPEATA